MSSGPTGRPASNTRTRRESTAAASTAISPGVRSRMQAQRTRDTSPEIAVRRLLHARGLRYRVDQAPLPGLRRRADVVFGPARVAVYVDGCFWHQCPQHGNQPRANSGYWEPKLRRNRERDAETDRLLAEAGWTVVRAWEHEAPGDVAARVEQAVRHGRAGAVGAAPATAAQHACRAVASSSCTPGGPPRPMLPAAARPSVSVRPADVPPVAVLDFFSGCGGTSAGLQAAGMRIAAGVDCDPSAAATYRRNFPDATFLEGDVRGIDVAALDAAAAGGAESGLVVSACAPCQPYSTLRRRNPPGNRDRSLLLTLLPFVDRLRPDAVVVENVPGMQKVQGASTFRRFVRALERGGYYVEWDVVDCRVYGVPQRRRRLVLLASRHGRLPLPAATHGPGLLPFATVQQWIGDLPPLEAGQVHPDDPNHRAGALGPLNLARIRSLKPGQGRESWPEHLWLECHRGFDGHEDVYGRLSPHAAAPVLTTKCTDLTGGRFGHPVQDRALSVREAACLQTFPRGFEFVGGLKSTTRQVGNAVPVLLAQRLGEKIVAHLAASQPAAP